MSTPRYEYNKDSIIQTIEAGEKPSEFINAAYQDLTGELYNTLAAIYEEKKDLANACNYYKDSALKGNLAAFKSLRRLADLGSKDAYFSLFWVYQKDIPSIQKANFKRAAECLYLSRHPDAENLLLQLSDKTNNSDVNFTLGLIYEEKGNKSSARLCYNNATLDGNKNSLHRIMELSDSDAVAACDLGKFHLRGICNILAADPKRAIDLFYQSGTQDAFQKLSDMVDNQILAGEVYYAIARLYEEGRARDGICFVGKPCHDSALMYYKKALQNGHRPALDIIRAKANNNDSAAKTFLALTYKNGIAGFMNPLPNLAIKLFYELGTYDAFRYLCDMVDENQNADNARYTIGLLGEEGRAVDSLSRIDFTANRYLAGTHYHTAARNGHALAFQKLCGLADAGDRYYQIAVAEIYERGEDAPNMGRAIDYYYLAAKAKVNDEFNEKALQRLQELAEKGYLTAKLHLKNLDSKTNVNTLSKNPSAFVYNANPVTTNYLSNQNSIHEYKRLN